MSENSKSAAFSMSSEQAVQVLCAALQGGAIKLPFGGVIDQETLNKYLDTEVPLSIMARMGNTSLPVLFLASFLFILRPMSST